MNARPQSSATIRLLCCTACDYARQVAVFPHARRTYYCPTGHRKPVALVPMEAVHVASS